MDIIRAIILGVVQGLTEFLPVSSSAHLIIAEKLLGFRGEGILFEILLHCATMLSVIIYFHKKIKELCLGVLGIININYRVPYYENKKMIWGVIVGTIPTAIIGYFFNDHIDKIFNNITLVGYSLIFTSLILMISDFFKPTGKLSLLKALTIGISQGLSVIPGISRSGITISTSVMLNIKRKEAVEFSFLLSIPSILGALILKFSETNVIAGPVLGYYLVSAFIAFFVGLISIYIVVKMAVCAKFKYFALYCLLIGIGSVICF
jgi:undecaprenyl-diphosphatase